MGANIRKHVYNEWSSFSGSPDLRDKMMGGLRGIVKYLRSSGAVFVYVLVIYFLLMVHQVADNADTAENADSDAVYAVNADYTDNAAPHRLRSHFLLMIHRIVDNIRTGFQFGRIHKISKV